MLAMTQVRKQSYSSAVVAGANLEMSLTNRVFLPARED